jgi:4-hydroxyphenylacetate 3-monooxygenase oxygenase component
MPPRSGQDYIDGLRAQPREVWAAGRRVEDVTSDPFFARSVQAIADLYQLQCDPQHRETMTYVPEDTGTVSGASYMVPRSSADLAKRRLTSQIWAEATYGTIGRSPDFLNTVLMAWSQSSDFFGQKDSRFGDNVTAYYRYCRDNDLFLTHALVNPLTDRSKASNEQDGAFAHLGIVKETSEGLIVRGAKMLATHGPTADELLVYPQPGLRPGEERHVIAFGIPASAPGLRFICREPFDDSRQTQWDHPLGARFEEPDAVCVFEDVLVPWNRVFLHNDIAMGNALFRQANIRNYTGHQTAIRGLAKTRFLTAVAIAMTRSVKTDGFLHVQEQLGEILAYLEMIESAILTSELKAQKTAGRAMLPAYGPLQALRYLLPKWYERMVQVCQVLGAGGLLQNPMHADFTSPIGGDVEAYFRGAGVDAQARTQIFKLAWDATSTQFGQRLLQYERYYGGDPVRVGAGFYLDYDVAPLMKMVERALKGE